MINIYFEFADYISAVKNTCSNDENIYFNYHLDVGKITNDDILNENRLLYLKKIKNPYTNKNNISIELLKAEYVDKLEYIIEKIKIDKKICIWLNHTAESICGFLYLNNLLLNFDTDVLTRIDKDNIVISGNIIGDMETLEEYQKTNLSKLWKLIIKEDGLLRVFTKNLIENKHINYYDSEIIQIIGTKKKSQRELNVILKKKNLPVLFINDRINSLIEEGKIAVVQDANIIHDRIICTAI